MAGKVNSVAPPAKALAIPPASPAPNRSAPMPISIGAAYQIGREAGRLRRTIGPAAPHGRAQIFELRLSNHADALALRTILKRIAAACRIFPARTIRSTFARLWL